MAAKKVATCCAHHRAYSRSKAPCVREQGVVKSSKDAQTRVTTRDDGQFVRTAIVINLKRDGERQGGSLDVVDQDGNFLVQIVISAGEDFIIVDTIDVEKRYPKRAAIAFPNKQQKRITIDDKGTIVSADFRMK